MRDEKNKIRETEKKSNRTCTAQFVYDAESMVMPLLSSVLKCDFSLFIVQSAVALLEIIRCNANVYTEFSQFNCNEYHQPSWMKYVTTKYVCMKNGKMAIISDSCSRKIKCYQNILRMKSARRIPFLDSLVSHFRSHFTRLRIVFNWSAIVTKFVSRCENDKNKRLELATMESAKIW